jgi:hypothetical protein
MRPKAQVLIVLALLAGLVSPLLAQDCVPPCRRGYTCQNSGCVSLCNPPCPSGYRCDPDLLDCVPIPQAPGVQTAAPARAETRDNDGPCARPGDCTRGRMCFQGKCEDPDWVASAGNFAFGSTAVIYGAGTTYCGVWSIIMSFRGYHDGHNEYDSYDRNTYEKDAVMGTIGPQSGAVLLFGGLNQIAKGKQALYLRELGAKPARRLVGVGWLMYGLSVTTMGLHLLSYLSDEPGFVRTTAFVNAGVLLSSFVVNVSGYFKQGKLLEDATGITERRRARSLGPVLMPYIAALPDGGAAGLALRF